jgi:hypothetical protein
VFRLHQFAALLISLDPQPEVYQYVFDALPIFFCTLALSVILPWQLDFAKAIGDVMEKLEWGLLAPIAWPIKKAIRKRREEKARKAQELREDPVETGEELHQLPKDQLPGV